MSYIREDPRYGQWLETVETEGRNLTKWEQDFVADLRDRFDQGRITLSERQAEILERIYAEKTP